MTEPQCIMALNVRPLDVRTHYRKPSDREIRKNKTSACKTPGRKTPECKTPGYNTSGCKKCVRRPLENKIPFMFDRWT